MSVLPSPIAWRLNFEADREFEAPGYTPSKAAVARMRELPSSLQGLVRSGDVLIGDAPSRRAGEGRRGRAWCPTPRALAALKHAGAIVPEAPTIDVLRCVNSRRFSAELGQSLPGGSFVEDEAGLRAALARGRAAGIRRWLLKSSWSTSGSGRLVLADGQVDDAALAWACRRLSSGVQVEPLVDRKGDFALHGHLSRDGRLVVGEPCLSHVSEAGAWLGTARCTAADLSAEERRALLREVERAGEALCAAGYFGPFNLDAFRYRADAGTCFNPRCEINARYTMGWAVGFGDLRPDLED